jgi:hypothetical protein
MAGSIYIDLDLARVPYVGGVPRFLYRETLVQTLRWLRRLGHHDGLSVLIEEVTLLEYLGFFAESWSRRRDAVPSGVGMQPDTLLGQTIER